jgi:hypothetical protein
MAEAQQHYHVVEDRGWVPDSVYGARLVVIAPIGGLGHCPEVDEELVATGRKCDARSDLPPRSGYRTPSDLDEALNGPAHMGLNSNHPGGPTSP